MVDWESADAEPCTADDVPRLSPGDVDCGTVDAEVEGLSFAESLVVGSAAVGDAVDVGGAGAGVLGDGVGLAGDGAKLVAAGRFEGEAEAGAEAVAPVPTGTFCRY